jgi:hypothetical protein
MVFASIPSLCFGTQVSGDSTRMIPVALNSTTAKEVVGNTRIAPVE